MIADLLWQRVVGSIIQICGWSSYSVLLWALKASLLVFYLRLTAGLGRGYQLRIYFGFGFLVVSWIAVVMNLFLACRPFHKNWQIYPNPGTISNQIVWVYLSFNVSTDLYLLSIPLPMLWQAKLRPAKKYGLLLLFSGGIFVVVCATLRCILIVTDPQNGAQLAGSWAVRETFVAVITANLPMVFSVVKNWLAPVFGSIITSLRSSQKLTEGTPKEIRTFGAGSNQSWRGRGPPSAYPITNVTFSESEERMVNEYKMQDLKPWGDPHGEPVDVGRSDGVQRSQSNRGKNTDIRKDVEVAITTEYVRDSGDELPQDYAYIKGTKRASSQIVSESK
ncbi:kinesin-like protein [Colletotrichum higginsianum]|nr:kinesin-like protein [Colletotrichum higginsianum]